MQYHGTTVVNSLSTSGTTTCGVLVLVARKGEQKRAKIQQIFIVIRYSTIIDCSPMTTKDS